MGLQRFLITVQTDESDLGRRHQFTDAVQQADARAQNRNNDDFLAEFVAGRRSDRRLNRNFLQRKITANLISHQFRDFIEVLTEVLGSCFLFAHLRQLMLNQGMVQYSQHVSPSLFFIHHFS